MSPWVDAGVLAEWLERKLESLSQRVERPHQVLASSLEVHGKQLYHWRKQLSPSGTPTSRQPRDKVEDALHRAGVFMWEVFEDDDSDDVVDPTTAGQRRSLDRIVRGKPAGVYGKLTDEQMLALNRLHMEGGLSVRELGRRIWKSAGFKTEHSAAMSMVARWAALDLPRRDQLTATRLASTTHGMRAKRGTPEGNEFRRKHRKDVKAVKCAATNCQGKNCGRWAQSDSDYCYAHRKGGTDEQMEQTNLASG